MQILYSWKKYWPLNIVYLYTEYTCVIIIFKCHRTLNFDRFRQKGHIILYF